MSMAKRGSRIDMAKAKRNHRKLARNHQKIENTRADFSTLCQLAKLGKKALPMNSSYSWPVHPQSKPKTVLVFLGSGDFSSCDDEDAGMGRMAAHLLMAGHSIHLSYTLDNEAFQRVFMPAMISELSLFNCCLDNYEGKVHHDLIHDL
ncbi:hypothetical protein AB4090_08380 [Acidithiobacillus sp. IBUN Pt1247-S3]|uniref:hypothetical protein n=1 Tax=Acidithiobacillus sp. IBUN Pt1247-S3 TaxID=3166642 RepID=UPI0034E5B0A8